jgi:hypothetical protein
MRKRGPKDLVQERKDAIKTRADDKARAAQRQARTTCGKTKEGKSNQNVRGKYDGKEKSSEKHKPMNEEQENKKRLMLQKIQTRKG